MTQARFLARNGVSAAGSLLINGLLIAVLLTMGAGGGHRTLEEHSLSVVSLAALKGREDGAEHAPSAEPATVAAPAEPAMQPPPVPAALPLPPVVVAPPLKVALPLAAPPVAPASASAPTSAPAAASRATAAPPSAAQGSAPPRRGIREGLDADAPAGRSLAYAARVRSWLYAHKIYPRRARMRREEGVVRVRFVINRAGELLEGVIMGSSGKSLLDEEAIEMMRRASPFPSAPVGISGERIEFTAPIEFTLAV